MSLPALKERSVYHTLFLELSMEGPDNMKQRVVPWSSTARHSPHQEYTHMKDAMTPAECLILKLN